MLTLFGPQALGRALLVVYLLGGGTVDGNASDSEAVTWVKESDPADEPLRAMGVMLFAEAGAQLSAARLPEANDPRLPLVEALQWLHAQPRTDGRVAAALLRLREIEEAGDPVLAPVAGFFHARVLQLHVSPVQVDAAVAQYERLYRRHPSHPLAQMGLVKRGMIRLFAAVPGPEREAVYRELEAVVGRMHDRTARRDMHALIGHAALLEGSQDERARRHLVAALESGVPESSVRYRGYLLRVAELALRGGDNAQARRFYQKFLDEYPRDIRRQEVEERLAGMTTTGDGL